MARQTQLSGVAIYPQLRDYCLARLYTLYTLSSRNFSTPARGTAGGERASCAEAEAHGGPHQTAIRRRQGENLEGNRSPVRENWRQPPRRCARYVMRPPEPRVLNSFRMETLGSVIDRSVRWCAFISKHAQIRCARMNEQRWLWLGILELHSSVLRPKPFYSFLSAVPNSCIPSISLRSVLAPKLGICSQILTS